MKSKILAIAAFCVMAVSGAMAEDAPSPSVSPPVITDKTRVYTKADIKPGHRDIYPIEALEAEKNGRSVVLCQVGPDGDLLRCIVEDEKPAGYGFGEAQALFHLQHSRVGGMSGSHKAGDWIRLTHNWTLN